MNKKQTRMCKKAAAQKSFSALIVYLFCLLLMTGCGGGNNPVSTLAQPPAQSSLKLVQGTATVSTPQNIAPESLTLTSGLLDEQKVSSSGTVSIKLNSNTTQVVAAKNASGNLMLMSIVVAPEQDSQVALNTQTTAEALVMLNPFIATVDKTKAAQVLQTLSALPEVISLATLLGSKLKTNPDILNSMDDELKQALAKATDAALTKLNEQATQKEKVTTFPETQQSGITVTKAKKNASTTTLTFTNTKKRYTEAFLDDTSPQQNVLIASKGDIFNILGSSTATLDVDTYKYTNTKLKIYGPGLNNLDNFTTDGKTIRALRSTVMTAMFDFGLPVVSMLTGLSEDGCLAKFVSKLAENMLNDSTFTANIGQKMQSGDLKGIIQDTVLEMAIRTITNKDNLLFGTLGDCAADAVKDVVVTIGVYLVPAVGQAKLAWDVSTKTLSLLSSITDFTTTSWLEVWDVKNLPPTVTATATPASGALPLTVSLSCSASGSTITKYEWDVDGNGTYDWYSESTGLTGTTSYTYNTAGNYTAVCRATDEDNAQGTGSVSISASTVQNQSPSATLSADITSGTPPLAVTFTIGYTDPEGAAGTYSLNFGDSTTAATGSINSGASTTVQHTYSSASTFTATLTVTDDKGATGTKKVSIDTTGTNQVPQCTLTADKTSGTAPLYVSFTATCTDSDGNLVGYKCTDGTDIPPFVEICLDSSLLCKTQTPPPPTCTSVTSYNTGTANGTWSDSYGTPGTYTATASITDSLGLKGTSAGVTITVTAASTAKTVQQVSAGVDHACAVLSDGTVKCWGWNFFGQLGNGSNVGPETCQSSYSCSTNPVVVSGLSGVTSISAGSHTCVLTASGGVKCWGNNGLGQLGNGTTTDSPTPVDVIGFTSGVVSVSAGEYHTCAVTSSGGVKCWGLNSEGQLGNGSNTGPEQCAGGSSTTTTTSKNAVLYSACSTAPVDVAGLTNGILKVSAGTVSTCALTTSGSVKCWGRNDSGELGNGTTTNSFSPVDVSGLSIGAAAIVVGGGYACALTSSSGVKCWGWNGQGQLGTGSNTGPQTCTISGSGYACSKVPVDVSGISSGVTVLSASNSACVVTTSGGVKCWPNASSYVPVDVSGLTSGVAFVSAGAGHTCAILSNGTVRCWGDNTYGQLGNGTTTNSTTPVDVSSSLYTLSPLQKLFYYAKLKFDFFLDWLKG